MHCKSLNFLHLNRSLVVAIDHNSSLQGNSPTVAMKSVATCLSAHIFTRSSIVGAPHKLSQPRPRIACRNHLRTYSALSAERMAPTIKLTYFDLEAAAEKVRLALTISGLDFEDKRIQFSEWQAMKPTVKYGQLPVLEVDGVELYQSEAQMKWAARMGDGSLYPSEAFAAYEVDFVMGMFGDFVGAWQPCLYMGMRPQKYGYPEGDAWPAEEKNAKVKEIREKFCKESMPMYMNQLTEQIEKHGNNFLCGDKITIADLQWYVQLRYFTKGVADHVPADILSAYPTVVAYISRVDEVPAIKAYHSK